jgi:hypothetical protein
MQFFVHRTNGCMVTRQGRMDDDEDKDHDDDEGTRRRTKVKSNTNQEHYKSRPT